MPTPTLSHRHAAAHLATLTEMKVTARPWSPYETYFYGALHALLTAEAARLAHAIWRQDTAAADDPAFWAAHEAALLTVLEHSLTDVVRFGVIAARESLGNPNIALSWNLVNTEAVNWARANAAQLVTDITETTRQGLRQAVADWSASGQPLGVLADHIQASGVFAPARARLIAQTESTNAFAQGNAQAWAAMGVQPAAYKPAAHPNCRCYLQPWRTPEGTTVMVWYTAADERVCTQPLSTPWGEVAGCKALHDTVVSQGPRLGSKK